MPQYKMLGMRLLASSCLVSILAGLPVAAQDATTVVDTSDAIAGTPVAEYPIDQFDIVASAEFFTETPINSDITTLLVYSQTAADTPLGQIGVTIGGGPPDFDAAAEALGISMDDLMTVMPEPAQ